jgi:hypothetical protein
LQRLRNTIWPGACIAALALLVGAPAALADSPTTSVVVHGQPVVGGTLEAVVTTSASEPKISYQWVQCDAVAVNRCPAISGEKGATYTPAASDVGHPLAVRVRVQSGDGSDQAQSAPTDPVAAGSPPPQPEPGPSPQPPPDPTPQPPPDPTPQPPPDPTPSPAPDPTSQPPDPTTTPAPAIEAATTTPTPTGQAVFVSTSPAPPASVAPAAPLAPTFLRYLTPFPVVRIAGVGVPGGADITLLRVTAPRGAFVAVSCLGSGCPMRHLLTTPGRIWRFEKFLRAGVTVTIRVYRPDAIGKFVRFVVRSQAAPKRTDACVLPGRTRPVRCPG